MSRRRSEKTEKLADGDNETEEAVGEVDGKNDTENKGRSSKRTKSSEKSKESRKGSSRKRSASKSLKESDSESDTEYEVSKILDVKTDKKGKKQFLVNWKGYASKDNSWEPEENLSCNDLIQEFLKSSSKITSKSDSRAPKGKKKKN